MNYQAISPDGLMIRPQTFKSENEALEYLGQWVERFRAQGFYRKANGEKIAFSDINRHCYIINTNN